MVGSAHWLQHVYLLTPRRSLRSRSSVLETEACRLGTGAPGCHVWPGTVNFCQCRTIRNVGTGSKRVCPFSDTCMMDNLAHLEWLAAVESATSRMEYKPSDSTSTVNDVIAFSVDTPTWLSGANVHWATPEPLQDSNSSPVPESQSCRVRQPLYDHLPVDRDHSGRFASRPWPSQAAQNDSTRVLPVSTLEVATEAHSGNTTSFRPPTCQRASITAAWIKSRKCQSQREVEHFPQV